MEGTTRNQEAERIRLGMRRLAAFLERFEQMRLLAEREGWQLSTLVRTRPLLTLDQDE